MLRYYPPFYLSSSCLADLVLSEGVWASDEYAATSPYVRLRSPSLSQMAEEIDEGGEATVTDAVDGATADEAVPIAPPVGATDDDVDDDDDELRLLASSERSTTSAGCEG